MKTMLTCVEIEGFLSSYLERTLPLSTRVLFRLHLLMCKECRAYIRAYKATTELATRTMQEPSKVDDIPPRLVEAIMSSIGKKSPSGDEGT